jgi:hypothetical protein
MNDDDADDDFEGRVRGLLAMALAVADGDHAELQRLLDELVPRLRALELEAQASKAARQ